MRVWCTTRSTWWLRTRSAWDRKICEKRTKRRGMKLDTMRSRSRAKKTSQSRNVSALWPSKRFPLIGSRKRCTAGMTSWVEEICAGVLPKSKPPNTCDPRMKQTKRSSLGRKSRRDRSTRKHWRLIWERPDLTLARVECKEGQFLHPSPPFL